MERRDEFFRKSTILDFLRGALVGLCFGLLSGLAGYQIAAQQARGCAASQETAVAPAVT